MCSESDSKIYVLHRFIRQMWLIELLYFGSDKKKLSLKKAAHTLTLKIMFQTDIIASTEA